MAKALVQLPEVTERFLPTEQKPTPQGTLSYPSIFLSHAQILQIKYNKCLVISSLQLQLFSSCPPMLYNYLL